LHCGRQGYLYPWEQELQIVMQQVEARTTRRTGIVTMWQKLKKYHVTVETVLGQQVPIFLVYDYHFNNKRFMSLVYGIHLAREWRLGSTGAVSDMLARPL
jgi:hypothetical protein